MSRETLLLLALGMLIVAALAVGLSGWMLFARDHRLARSAPRSPQGSTGGAAHPEAHEEH
jgi:hypothetical protein